MKRTNNYAKGFHSGFTQLIGCTNPTIWAFLRALKLQQSITDGKMTAEIFGERPPKMCSVYPGGLEECQTDPRYGPDRQSPSVGVS